jgi:hypothetical protein
MSKSIYRVIGRAPATVIFRQGDSLEIPYTRDGKSAKIVISTRYLNAGFEIPVPGDLMVVVDAEADTATEAYTWLTVGREMASLISIATNAAIKPIEGEIAYDITPGKQKRELFQRFIEGENIAFSSRSVPMNETMDLFESIVGNEHRDRLLRAIAQYNEALLRWAYGSELLIMSHLWMGVEAITKAYLRHHIEKRQIAELDLAAEWGFKPNGGHMKQDQFLTSEARVRLVCQGDVLHHRIARQVSDYFEHGLENFGTLFEPSRNALIPIARYLREAIFIVSGMSADGRQTLLNDPYARPRGPGGFEHYFRTTLVGEGEELSPEDQDYPHCDWRYQIVSASFSSETGLYSYKPDHKLTARIGKDINLVGGRLEVWDAGYFKPESAAEKAAKDVD